MPGPWSVTCSSIQGAASTMRTATRVPRGRRRERWRAGCRGSARAHPAGRGPGVGPGSSAVTSTPLLGGHLLPRRRPLRGHRLQVDDVDLRVAASLRASTSSDSTRRASRSVSASAASSFGSELGPDVGLEGFEAQAQGGQRRAQLVGGVGDEPSLGLDELGEAVGGEIERLRQGAELGRAVAGCRPGRRGRRRRAAERRLLETGAPAGSRRGRTPCRRRATATSTTTRQRARAGATSTAPGHRASTSGR